MRIGAIFPQTEIGDDPGVIRDYVQVAEHLGFSHVLAFDHVLGAEHEDRSTPLPGPYTERDTFHEPLTLFSYWAGITTDIEFVTGVLVLPQRQTALVAKQAAQVALLSGNRLRLGVGVGWNPVEFAALGMDFHSRGRRQEEQVSVLRRLWSERSVEYSGRWHEINRAAICPLPTVPIPIWFGGLSDAAYSRAAALGDGFIFGRGTHPALTAASDPVGQVIKAATALRERVAANGRDASSFGLEARILMSAGPASWEKDIARLAAAGFNFVSLHTTGSDLRGAAHIDALQRFAQYASPRDFTPRS